MQRNRDSQGLAYCTEKRAEGRFFPRRMLYSPGQEETAGRAAEAAKKLGDAV